MGEAKRIALIATRSVIPYKEGEVFGVDEATAEKLLKQEDPWCKKYNKPAGSRAEEKKTEDRK